MSLRENVALVTGGSRGIGRAVCVELARLGAAVAVNYAGNSQAAQETANLCRELGVEVVRRPVASAESGFVRHQPDALARELLLLHAERSVRIAGGRRGDAYQMEEPK